MSVRRQIGRYTLGESLGAGGMGNVYAAVMNGPLGFVRAVAVKELHPHLARDADFVAMLLEEARIQGALEHPNVVSVLDAVALGGELFIVLSLVDGVALADLARRMRERDLRMPAPVVVGVLCDVLEGLHAAHELRGPDQATAGVIHRDVSPHNVLLGADGVARLVDFGVAKAMGRSVHTRGGALKGKPMYMSPEQLDGEPLDRRTDVYSAALVGVELLTGRRACPAGEPAEVRRWRDASFADPERWLEERAVPESLREPLARCLSRDRDERPTSAREAGVALAQAMERATAADVAAWVAEVGGDLIEARREIALRVRGRVEASIVTATTQTHGVPPSDGVRPAWSRTAAVAALCIAAGAFGHAVFRGQIDTTPARLAIPAPSEVLRASEPTPARTSASAASAPSAERLATGEPSSELARSRPRAAATAVPAPLPMSPAVWHPPSVVSSSAATSARSQTAVRTASTAGHAAPGAAASFATGSCDPPYTVDGMGVRVFKPECL